MSTSCLVNIPYSHFHIIDPFEVSHRVPWAAYVSHEEGLPGDPLRQVDAIEVDLGAVPVPPSPPVLGGGTVAVFVFIIVLVFRGELHPVVVVEGLVGDDTAGGGVPANGQLEVGVLAVNLEIKINWILGVLID